MQKYIHGFSETEQERLLSQSKILAQYIYPFMDLSPYKKVLEAGMGVGAQTILLLEKYPNLHIHGLELSTEQISKAKHNLSLFSEYADRWDITQANLKSLPESLPYQEIEAVFFIWVLEHIPNPEEVLKELKTNLKKGTVVYITEVVQDSLYLYPRPDAARQYWDKCLDFQYNIHCDPDVGMRLKTMLTEAGFKNIEIKPCVISHDKTEPEKRLAILKYWKSLMFSALDNMLQADFCTMQEWEACAQDMDNLMENPETIFYYHSVQARFEIGD